MRNQGQSGNDSRAAVLVVGASLKACVPTLANGAASVALCPDQKSALKMLGNHRYHAVVCDLDSPEMQSMQFLSRVIEEYPHVAVVAVTKHNNLRRGILAMISGASAYMLRPLHPENVADGLARALRAKRLEIAMRGSTLRRQRLPVFGVAA